MLDQDAWASIRLLHRRQSKSKSWIARELGISRNTVSKYIKDDEAPKYRVTQPRGKPISDKWREHVRLILEDDRNAPRKQKHTAKRIFERLVDEHQFTGSYRTVRRLVADIKNKPGQAVYLPLQFKPGKDAQVDFGESYADIDGERTKIHIFEMRLNYSRKKFVMAVRAANMESFMEAHVRAFEFFQGVPERLVEQKGPSDGGRDYVRVLRCHMQYGATQTAKAIRECAAVGLISADAVLQVVAQARFATTSEITPLDMAERPGLRDYLVKLEETARYQILLGEVTNEHCIA